MPQGQTSARILCVVDPERTFSDAQRARLDELLPGWTAISGGAIFPLRTPDAVPDTMIVDLDAQSFDGPALLDRLRYLRPTPLILAVGGGELARPEMRLFGLAHARFADWDALLYGEALPRYLWLRAELRTDTLSSLVRGLWRLPVMPATYVVFRQKLREPGASMQQLAAIIEKDPALSAQVLRAANSGYFGPRRELRRVADAASILGTNLLGHLILVFGVFQDDRSAPVGKLSAAKLQLHSLLTGVFAHAIASDEGQATAADDAFLAGSLHHIGLLALLQNYPVRLADVSNWQMQTDGGQCAAEREAFGADHAVIGGAILGHWNIPFDIVQAVFFHHAPEKHPDSGLNLSAIIHLASACAAEFTGLDDRLEESYFEKLGQAKKIDAWRNRCRQIYRESSV